MTYALGFFWLFLGASVILWVVAALFGKITRKFVYSGQGDNSPRLIFQITTKYCPETVERGVASIRKSCAEIGFTNYDVWIVTLNPTPNLKDKKARWVFVPESFKTVAKFKARSLEFARQLRAQEGYSGWIYYIDEENWITAQTVKAITNFAIHGNAKLASGPLVFRSGGSYPGWLGDSIRSSEGRISCMLHSLGYWSVHGDNMLMDYSLEKEVGWEFPQLTEDVQFTGHALDKGYRTGWHGGELQTVSATSINDFTKQRRRWFRGILQCIFSPDISARYRLLQAYIAVTGLLGTVVLFGVALDLFFNITPFARAWFYSVPLITTFAFTYFIGCRSSFKDRLAAGLFCWFFTLLEGIGAWSSIFAPPKGFDIIKKT